VEARVIAIADTYDAMTSSRSHRAARDHDSALEEIRRVAGTQLDADLASAFERLCEEGAEWVATKAATREGEDE
jgi:HD-GYP domain-containing protein (c-di-GMP phosphodiesterase class II)